MVLVVKNLPAQCRRCKRCGFNPWVGNMATHSSLEEGDGNRLQYSCLENPWTEKLAVHRVTKSQTRLKQLSTTSNTLYSLFFDSFFSEFYSHGSHRLVIITIPKSCISLLLKIGFVSLWGLTCLFLIHRTH